MSLSLLIKQAKKILKSVGVDEDIELNEYEVDIAVQVCNPDSIKVSFNEIGGLDDVISAIKTDVISLVKNPSVMSRSSYYRTPKGKML